MNNIIIAIKEYNNKHSLLSVEKNKTTFFIKIKDINNYLIYYLYNAL